MSDHSLFCKLVLATAAIILHVPTAQAVAHNVLIPKSTSPHHKYYLRLTEDRSKRDEEADISPQIKIVAASSKKVVATLDFNADPNDDLQPVRGRMDVSWAPDDTALAIVFHDRHYSFLYVYRLDGTTADPEDFSPVTLPDTEKIIATLIPRFREFRPRWGMRFHVWRGSKIIEFSAGTGALMEPTAQKEDPNIVAYFLCTVDIRDPEAPRITKLVPDADF